MLPPARSGQQLAREAWDKALATGVRTGLTVAATVRNRISPPG